ncbi:MAG: hypothetical protein HY306_04330 [Nitrosomonadales bacterium]|nr:hypothetical protein [Nitrosomonadales bacterium]
MGRTQITKYILLLLLTMQGCTVGNSRMPGAPSQPSTAAQPSDEALDCADHAVAQSGPFRVENNTWGKGVFESWSQCVNIRDRGVGRVSAHWTWNWPDTEGGVQAYPEVIFGQKPGKQTTTNTLPRNLGDIQTATVSLDYASYHTGAGNLSFDIWLADTAKPTEFAVPPITHEIMIWLDSYGDMKPSSHPVGRVSINGFDYEIFVSEKIGKGWRYIAFQRTQVQTGSVRLDLVPFFSYLKSNKLITGNEFVASIELGNEIIRGAGETRIDSYSASIR